MPAHSLTPSCPLPDSAAIAASRKPDDFSARLLRWWDTNGRQDLPWQQPRTPYRVWVSEIMLQQTQVTTVIPYFERWMQDFADISTLAAAPLDDILAHWAGLGYYARARNLHRAAVICAEKYGGELPAGETELTALPGIGRSTANAIISQSTDTPAAVLDGNVRRVLARHARVDGWSGSAAVQKILWAEAQRRLPRGRGADYTQAIMDLGALLCTRSNPACGQCPVNADCQALAVGLVDKYPAPKPATRVTQRRLEMLVLLHTQAGGKQRVLLEKRPPRGIWGGLWCLPEAPDRAALEDYTGLDLADGQPLPVLQHRLSHQHLSIQPILLSKAVAKQVKCSSEQRWVTLGSNKQPGMPKPVAQLLQQLAGQTISGENA